MGLPQAGGGKARYRQHDQGIRRCEGIDQVAAAGCAPARAKIIAGDGEIVAGIVGVGGVAVRNVVKVGRITRSGADGVNGGIKEADGGISAQGGLLIDQGCKSRPQRRGAACT